MLTCNRALVPRQNRKCLISFQRRVSVPRAHSQTFTNTSTIKFFSPSKINLFLRVTKRRTDGYHDLASLFHVIDLGDRMEFEVLPYSLEDVLECNDPTIPTDRSNLVIKALDAFRRRSGILVYFRVKLDKRVPHGAGLGGGSGNAATALWAANILLGKPAMDEELLEWAADVGSDVSFFFSRGAAYCTGRGEVVEDVPSPLPKDTPLLLVKPTVGLSTPRIFKALDLARRSTADPRELLAALVARGAVQDVLVNDLEQPAFDNLPELRELKRRLLTCGAGYSGVVMTGSGSTIVCVGGAAGVVPEFLRKEPKYKDVFVSSAKLITRDTNKWFQA